MNLKMLNKGLMKAEKGLLKNSITELNTTLTSTKEVIKK